MFCLAIAFKMRFQLVIILFAFTVEISGQGSLCKDSCAANKTFSLCSPGQYQANCCNLSPHPEESTCESGCVCKKGFVRDANTCKCILLKNCPATPAEGSETCPRNEIWTDCGFGCDETCGFTVRDLTCKSCLPGCICQPGFVRSSINGQCIARANCKGYY